MVTAFDLLSRYHYDHVVERPAVKTVVCAALLVVATAAGLVWPAGMHMKSCVAGFYTMALTIASPFLGFAGTLIAAMIAAEVFDQLFVNNEALWFLDMESGFFNIYASWVMLAATQLIRHRHVPTVRKAIGIYPVETWVNAEETGAEQAHRDLAVIAQTDEAWRVVDRIADLAGRPLHPREIAYWTALTRAASGRPGRTERLAALSAGAELLDHADDLDPD